MAMLSNLVTMSKTHATSLGMSPISLLDAAACIGGDWEDGLYAESIAN